MTGYFQARPYDTGPGIDPLAILGTVQQMRSRDQQSGLDSLQLQMAQEKHGLAQQQLARQQAYIAALPEDQRSLAALDPSGYVGAMIDRLKPHAGVAVPEGGSVVDPYTGRVLLQGTPSVTWGDSSVGQGGGANLMNARPQQAPAVAGGSGGNIPAVSSVPLPAPSPYANAIQSRENTTGNPAAKNPNSSAVGNHQFLDETWLDVLGKYRPDLVRGKSRDEILQMRADPALSASMADVYARENTAALTQAGFEPTPANLALAHRFGAAGAAKILAAERANPNAPLSSVLPEEVLKVNKELRTMTIAQGRAMFEQQMAGVAGAGGNAAAAAPPAAAPGSYDIRYDKGKPTEYPGKPGYVVARDKASGKIIAVPAPSEGQTEAERLKAREVEQKDREANSKEGDTRFNNENTLRDEFNTLTKDYRVVSDSYRKIHQSAAAGNGAGDMSMLYSFVKLLDPNSVVRESEFALAAQSGSYGERIQGAVERLLTGKRLPEGLRAEFLAEADNLYQSQKSGFDKLTERYRGIANRRGLNAENVVGDYGEGAGKTPAGRPPPGGYRAPLDGEDPNAMNRQASALPPGTPALPPGFRMVK